MYTEENLDRVNNDVNGNPRYVIHYLALLTDEEKADTSLYAIANRYSIAIARAKKLFGGKKFHNKQYGGGIVFQSYNVKDELALINAINAINTK